MRPDDLHPDPLHALQRLASGDERREEQIAEWTVFVEEQQQRAALDCDVAKRFDHESAHENCLTRKEVQFAKESGGALPYQLVAGRVDDRDFSLEDRDERIGHIADSVQQLTGSRRALLADLGESRQLRRRE